MNLYIFADDLQIGGVAPIIFDSEDAGLKARTVGRCLGLSLRIHHSPTSDAGVLTKVDRMADGMGPTWLETFNNNGPRQLDNGWFAVKLPSRDHIPWKTAREQEREWFKNNELWESEDRNRMGSEQLTHYISRLLSNLVADRCVYHCCSPAGNLTSMRKASGNFPKDYRNNR